MSLISSIGLHNLIQLGIINANPEHVNAASVDITLGNEILREDTSAVRVPKVVDLKAKDNISTKAEVIPEQGILLYPGQFILASSAETFNLPNNIAAEYKLKSSLARNGLQHLLAGWCDPGWNGSKLTLELKNVTQNHILLLKPGMKIGQMVFWECEEVPEEHSYATKGQYNGDNTVTGSKGVR